MIRRLAFTAATGVFAAVTACAAPAASGPEPAAPQARAAIEPCRAVAPASLGSGPFDWVGNCTAGKAEGPGMVRPRGGGVPETAFYGRMNAGIPDIGIVELPSGFKAGRFSGGDIVTGSDMDERDLAFETAAGAAREVARRASARGDARLARAYEEKARVFILQIE